MAGRSDRVKRRLQAVLRVRILRAGITESEFARRCGLPLMTVRNYLLGRCEPTVSRLFALDRGLGEPEGFLACKLAEPKGE